jgi:small subunit ribosomal protein S18
VSVPPAGPRRPRWTPAETKEGHELARKRKREPRREKKDEAWQKKQRKKVCIFCRDHVDYVDFKDTGLLRRFTSDRGKIRARRVTGTCAQHQRDVASAVKNAREMALLPYSTR